MLRFGGPQTLRSPSDILISKLYQGAKVALISLDEALFDNIVLPVVYGIPAGNDHRLVRMPQDGSFLQRTPPREASVGAAGDGPSPFAITAFGDEGEIKNHTGK